MSAGVVAGSVADLGEVGSVLDNDGVRILHGEKPENIPVATGDFQYYVLDWRQLKRWGIPQGQVPKEGEIRYWEYSQRELYRKKILGLNALLIVTLLIFLLLHNTVKRKRTQQALRRKESEFLEAQRLAQVGNWSWNPTTQDVSAWSEELYRIYGLNPAAPLPSGPEFGRLFTPESWAQFSATLERAKQTGWVPESELEIVRPDGSRSWVCMRGEAVRDASGHVLYLRGTVQDITERKQAAEVRSRLAAIVESTGDAIISKDLDGIIVSWNQGAQRMFGYSMAEAVGKPISILVPHELLSEQTAILQEAKAGKKVEHYETVRVTKDGKKIDVSLTMSLVRDAAGRILGTSTIARNITEKNTRKKN
jgi:hypothetical protein